MRKKYTRNPKDDLPGNEDQIPNSGSSKRRFSNLPENYENDEYEALDSFYYSSDDEDLDDPDREPELEELRPDVDEEDFDIVDDDEDEF